MLTYEAIRKIVVEERASQKLVALPDDFFSKVNEYLKRKQQIADTKEDSWELASAKRVLQDLLEIRERKILNLALYSIRSGTDPKNMIPEEREFFEKISAHMKEFQSSKKGLIEGRTEKTESLAFLEDVPAFVGTDMQTYGPFKKGDVATLPESAAKILVDKNAARLMRI